MPSSTFMKVLLQCFVSLFLILLLPIQCKQQQPQGQIEFRAKDSSTTETVFEFTNIIVEMTPTSQVYLGARNHLYQLDKNLQMVSEVVTGPVENNIICNCKRPTELTDNINKLLLIDYQNNRIITCGSIEEGLCDLRELGNLQRKLSNFSVSEVTLSQHVAAPGTLSTIGFLVPARDNQVRLYVGSSKTEQDVKSYKSYTSYFTISNRTLPSDNLSKNMFKSSRNSEYVLEMKQNYANQDFRITFIDGFSYSLTGYFIITHPSSIVSEEATETTYISQMCLEDWPALSSYHELPIECNVEGIKYTKAISSRIAEVGIVLVRNLGLSTGGKLHSNKVLFVSFIQSNGRPGSAVCMFPLQTIEKQFASTIKQCVNSNAPPTHVSWIKSKSVLSCRGVSFFHI